MSKKILIIGANGMLGGSLLRHFSSCENYEVLGSTRNENSAQKLKKQGFDNIIPGISLESTENIDKLISEFKPDFLFNCVGIIKQLDSSKNHIESIEINALLPHKLAKICTKNQTKLIHFSTDCVFSGKNGLYKETDIADASDLYGKSKLLGEVLYDGHITLRTSIIGHEIDTCHSLVDWFLYQNKAINGFSKAIFSGLPTCYVAEILEEYVLPNQSLAGLYHLSVDPINKYELLKLVNSIYNKNCNIYESKELVIDRSLDSSLFREKTGFIPEDWNSLIRKMNYEYKKYF
ncbi:dTDP-4-dehydrorhamnose reductase family protein [Xenorhabdus doucetiae]|uniref:dTDP-4-dehydrorhamnose reductase n=1 Tax=Xenorhabdus doucetiae TaxID=351671 RepID=A0A068QMK5_9GAMM|nr:SDR family oxidoreductase [Xenorhabdus doucetiae]TYP07811.1 dTDP-4-dehydrorhamnose reductase [Xenorhabdus doucetiae]CDG15874.1 dTDP-4-dehydrorhamnose reductase (L-QuiNAc synthase) [Xenorhabdus doucetiae]